MSSQVLSLSTLQYLTVSRDTICRTWAALTHAPDPLRRWYPYRLWDIAELIRKGLELFTCFSDSSLSILRIVKGLFRYLLSSKSCKFFRSSSTQISCQLHMLPTEAVISVDFYHLWPICTKPVTCRGKKHKLSFSYVQKEETMGFNLVQKTFLCSNNAQHQARDEKGQKGWRCLLMKCDLIFGTLFC